MAHKAIREADGKRMLARLFKTTQKENMRFLTKLLQYPQH